MGQKAADCDRLHEVRTLVVAGKQGCDPKLLESLERHGQVSLVENVEEAADLLSAQHVDLVVCHPDAIPRLGEVGIGTRAARILEALDSSACIFDASGNLLWGNARARRLPPELLERVRKMCSEAFGAFAEGQADESKLRSRRFSIHLPSNQYFEATLTPIRDPYDPTIQIAGIIHDATHARRLQQKVDAIDQAGRELVRLDAEHIGKLDAAQRVALLEERIICFTKDLMHFDNFAVLLVDRKANKLEMVLASGLPEDVRDLDIYVSTEGNGISGYVAATGRSYNCPDVTKDARYLPGIRDARSSLTIPLRLHDRVIGVFNFESTKPNAFTEDDRQFAEIFGRYLALAINFLDLLIVERSTTTGRLADNVSAEIAGPLNDILSDTYSLMEDYIGHDDMRRRLQTIVDSVATIRESIKQVARPAGGILGQKLDATPRDPLLADKRILVVDDEQIIRETISDVLTRYGSVVETARDGADAVAMLERNPYDLVLSDIRMPNRNGYQIFAAAKDARTDLPVILMTGFGYDPNHSIIRARREGLAAVLFKPFKVDDLIREIRTALTPAQ